jgi:hypothetical protein
MRTDATISGKRRSLLQRRYLTLCNTQQVTWSTLVAAAATAATEGSRQERIDRFVKTEDGAGQDDILARGVAHKFNRVGFERTQVRRSSQVCDLVSCVFHMLPGGQVTPPLQRFHTFGPNAASRERRVKRALRGCVPVDLIVHSTCWYLGCCAEMQNSGTAHVEGTTEPRTHGLPTRT